MYSHITATWQKLWKERSEELKSKAIEWRQQPSMLRIDRPSNISRARRLGYKAKQGFIVVRVRVGRGGMRKQRPKAGRRPKHFGVVRIKQSDSMRKVAERRVAQKHPNMQVIGSYYLHKDGKYYWFECILVDKNHPSIYNDRELKHVLRMS
ncbi:MAG: 50S ribosomal protein L15e [Nitrososphaerales archaeon]